MFYGKVYKVGQFFFVMAFRFIFVIGILLIFVSGCTDDYPFQESALSASDGQIATFEIGIQDYGNPSTTFDTHSSRDDLFAKWQRYNEQEMRQDKWDAVMGTDENDGDDDDNDEDQNETVRRGSGVPLRDY